MRPDLSGSPYGVDLGGGGVYFRGFCNHLMKQFLFFVLFKKCFGNPVSIQLRLIPALWSHNQMGKRNDASFFHAKVNDIVG